VAAAETTTGAAATSPSASTPAFPAAASASKAALAAFSAATLSLCLARICCIILGSEGSFLVLVAFFFLEGVPAVEGVSEEGGGEDEACWFSWLDGVWAGDEDVSLTEGVDLAFGVAFDLLFLPAGVDGSSAVGTEGWTGSTGAEVRGETETGAMTGGGTTRLSEGGTEESGSVAAVWAGA
jgi:hypothetical protein